MFQLLKSHLDPHHYPHLQQILNTGTQVSLPPIPLPGLAQPPFLPWVGAAPQIGLLPHCPPTLLHTPPGHLSKTTLPDPAGTGWEREPVAVLANRNSRAIGATSNVQMGP